MCVENAYQFTPLDIAVYRGHARLVTLLIRVAFEQYTPTVRCTTRSVYISAWVWGHASVLRQV